MSFQERLPIFVDPSQPQLLEGLNDWLRLGLIDDVQVKQFSQRYLICSISPELIVAPTTQQSQAPNSTGTDFASEEVTPPIRQPALRRVERSPTILTQLWQSFREELSIRSLLFLGLFLVVASSFTLAGTQWQNFSQLSQYLVLWLYTVVFSVVGIWANRQVNLSLTAKTLQTIATLLIPINFWAIDAFGVWESVNGWILGSIASIILVGICYFQNRSRYPLLFFFNFLGLSLIHLGWRIEQFPVAAIYIGLVVTAIILNLFLSPNRLNQLETSQNNSKNLILYALSVLLIRAIFILKLPTQQLGLAIGIFGWLVPERSQQESRENIASFYLEIQEAIGIILLFVGWWIAFTEDVPWQATIISGLYLQFFFQRLQRTWGIVDLLAIFIIGFQVLFTIRDLLPTFIKEISVNFWMQLTYSQEYSSSIYSVTLFPYIISWIWFTGWLYSRNKAKLAHSGEWLTLGLGIVLSLLSLTNDIGRSLNMSLSTATLAYVLYRRPIRVPLLYFTHLIGLGTICSIIDNLLPNLDSTGWAIVLLIIMVVEWGIGAIQTPDSNLTLRQYWYRSCWHFGFLLAAISYVLLWLNVDKFVIAGKTHYEVLAWLLTPITLTGVAVYSQGNRRQNAVNFSSYSLLASQLLTIWQPDVRLISLWVSAGVMLANSFLVRQLLATRIQVGFTLAAILVSIWEQFFKADELLWIFFRDSNWALVNAITLTCLWLLSLGLKQRQQTLFTLFSKATDEWAIFLCYYNVLQLTLHSIGVIIGWTSPSWQLLLSCLLVGTIIAYHYWKEPNDLAVYGVIWTVELFIVESVFWNSKDLLVVATVNLIVAFCWFGLTTQLLTRFTHLSQLTSLKISPLFFAAFCIFWRLGEFDRYTGLLTLGAAIVGIAVSQRLRQGKFLTYLSLLGITAAIYEWVIYQLLQQTEVSVPDRILIFSLVTVAIGIIYRLVVWWGESKGYESIGHISLVELYNMAHGHWGLAVILKIVSGISAVDSSLNPFLLVSSLATAGYAILQARNRTNEDSWVELGLLDVYGTAILARLIWQELGRLDPFYGAIVCVIAFGLYYCPWRRWGWSVAPWQRVALISPTLTAILTFSDISYFSLLLIAVFYAQIALRRDNLRWSYVSLGFVDWAILRLLAEQDLTDILYYAFIVGLSILYIAQVDPLLRQPNNRKLRHYWRVAGSGIICLTALLFHQETGITPGIISLITIFVGLGLKIRAFLYVGTITFILTVCYQLLVLIGKYAFSKWVIGLIVGIILITIAANFERRREQVLSLLQNWTEQLNEWQ